MKTDTNNIKKEEEDVIVYHIKDKVTIMSPYKLSETEIKRIKEAVKILSDKEIVNIIDPNIYSGFIVKIGSKLMDYTLNGALQHLKQQIYESN